MGKPLRDLDFDDHTIMAPGKSRPGSSPSPAAPASPAPPSGDFTPTTGKALFAWAKQMTPKAGFDVLVKVKAWGKDHDCPPDLFRWDSPSVMSCHAALASIVRSPHDESPTPSDPPFVPVRSDPVPVAAPRPLTAMGQPFNGSALRLWAERTSRTLGLDVLSMIDQWAMTRQPPLTTPIGLWDIGDVTDCMGAMAKELDRKGLLAIPAEARAQMPQERPPSDRVRGPLTIDPRDPLNRIKVEIKETAKKVFRATSKEDPTEESVMEYIRGCCKRHGLVVPDSIRNLGVSSHLTVILSALREEEREMDLFPGHDAESA